MLLVLFRQRGCLALQEIGKQIARRGARRGVQRKRGGRGLKQKKMATEKLDIACAAFYNAVFIHEHVCPGV